MFVTSQLSAKSSAEPRLSAVPVPPLRQAPDITHVTLAEILGALSHALDMTEGQPVGHCVRCCWIGMAVGEEAGLDEGQLWDLYYTLLLKDLGCSSNAARICQLYLADDLTFKEGFKRIDRSLPKALGFVLSHTGLKAGLSERFRAVLHIVQHGGTIARELIETRCQRGAAIARTMRFSDAVAEAISALDEHWDGGGKPLGLSGTGIPVHARIALLAQVADVFHTSEGAQAALAEVCRRSGTWFDPTLVAAFERAAARPAFWSTLGSAGLQRRVLTMGPARQRAHLDGDYLDDIAAAFALVVDSKSPYTAGHSERVTLFADLTAEELGIDAEGRRWLRRAALLHDIGKLGVSNTILDKPGQLDDTERTAMKEHARHTEAILSRIAAFRDLAAVAGAHHERLDGSGYPKGLKGDAIAFETRILAVADVFDALTADRPYRSAMPVSQALAIMQRESGTALDSVCLGALTSALARLDAAAA